VERPPIERRVVDLTGDQDAVCFQHPPRYERERSVDSVSDVILRPLVAPLEAARSGAPRNWARYSDRPETSRMAGPPYFPAWPAAMNETSSLICVGVKLVANVVGMMFE
jgi:hypothetical protein